MNHDIFYQRLSLQAKQLQDPRLTAAIEQLQDQPRKVLIPLINPMSLLVRGEETIDAVVQLIYDTIQARSTSATTSTPASV